MSQQVLNKTKNKMKDAEKNLERDLGAIRAGRANASLLEGINVSYYGTNTPLNQIAQITVPEARMLMVSPYDKNSLEDIEKAISKADLGISPSNDGDVIRLVIPQLTEERRREIAKKVGEEQENAKVAVRNIRREGMDELEELENAGELSEDELHRFEQEVQAITDASVDNIDQLAADKEKEIIEN